MFILLFFSFSFSKSQILDDVISRNNKSDKYSSIAVNPEESAQAANGLKKNVIQKFPKHYLENLSLFSSHSVSEPNLESDKETVVDENNTKPFQDEKTAFIDLEQKVIEIAGTIKTQHPELYVTLETKAYEFSNKMQPNELKDFISLQEEINSTNKKLVALKIKRDLEIVKKLLKEKVVVTWAYYENFKDVITFFLETFKKNCPQTELEEDAFFEELRKKVNNVDPNKQFKLEIQKMLGNGIAKIGKYLEEKTTLGITQEELSKIEQYVSKETLLEITAVEEKLSNLEKILKSNQNNFKNGINQFIVLEYVLNKKTDKNSDLYKKARTSIADYYIAATLEVFSLTNDIIMEELGQDENLTDSEIELKNTKIAHKFYKNMITCMKQSLEFKKIKKIIQYLKL